MIRALFASILLLFGGGREMLPQTIKTPYIAVLSQKTPIIEAISAPIELLPELLPICACETTGSSTAKATHFNSKGEVLRGIINSNDIGICQINLDHHQKKAEQLKLDLFKEQDNIIYANMLYVEEGSKPWLASRVCWNKIK